MSQNFSQNSIQSALGYYFKTPSLLSAAFTHTSFSDTENNEGLVFLGERLLDFVISDYIFSRYPFSVEKELVRRLEDFKKALDYPNFISSKGLSKCINLSASSESLRESKTLHGEIFLATVAAIYKDGGLPSLKAFILPLLRAADNGEHYLPKDSAEADTRANTVKKAPFEAKSKTSSVTKSALSLIAKTEKAESGKSDKVKETGESTKAVKVKGAVEDKKSSEPKFTVQNKKDGKSEKNTEEKPEEKSGKKGVNILKAIMLTSKNRKKDTETTPAAISTEKEETEVKEQKRSFIRDALTPVSLPESMRNPKPRKSYKAAEKTASAADTETQKSETTYTDDSENYKSLLQEYVQKNIRSANVLIKYTTERVGSSFVTEISLDGKVLAKADGAVKKLSEKAAAKIAYEELNNAKGSLSSWFSTLSEQGIAPQKAPDNYISKLNEYYQKKSHSSAAPLTYEPRPSSERKSFSVAIMFDGEELAVGNGHNVKDAKQDAAKKVCEKLKI